jgi:hypothetical protein
MAQQQRHGLCLWLIMDAANTRRIIIPDAFQTTAERTPSGAVIIRQWGDAGDEIIIIPAEYVKRFCDGVYHASLTP